MVSPTLQEKVDRAMHHHRQRELPRAEELYRQVLRKDGKHLIAMHLLSALLMETDRNEKAIDLLRRATELAPAQAIFFANLGEAQRRLQRYDDARASLERAIALQPELAEAHYTLGLTLQAERYSEAAIASFERAAAIKPGLVPVYPSLAMSLFDLGRLDEARAACACALELEPELADAHAKLGLVLMELGRVGEAIVSYRRAIASQPDNRAAHSNLVFSMIFHPAETPASMLGEATRWAERHAAVAPGDLRPHTNDRDPERRLRVGYVSPDFREHCQALFFVPVLEHRVRAQVEVFCYSMVAHPDKMTARIQGLSDGFRDIAKLSDADASDAIRRDGIDVLVDLTMHMGGNRLQLFASKPAPVQVAWLAYPGTTGLPAMDYRITDVHLDPPDVDVSEIYSERSVCLPDSFWCYDPLTRAPEVNPLPASRDGTITFGCLNSYKKTNAEVFALWARVLRAVDRSRLLLLAQPGEPRARARDEFARAGVDPDRLEFVELQARRDYLAHYHRIDCCLDTFPAGGHTTSLDSFWMGVPVVALLGRTAVGRAGLCYARNLGLEELVAETPDQFVAIAVDLTRDLPRLARLRAELRGRMERSPLMDGPRFARNLESAYRGIWRRWCETPSR
jgi:predicted O-linked N-acetylglucosamine transferase (SPINDLY family)